MAQLARLVEDDYRAICYQDYTATLLKILTESFVRFAGGDWQAPSFIELVYPKKDNGETAESIKEKILSRLQ